MADTVVHDDETWSRRADNSIWMWDAPSSEWKQWQPDPNVTFPLPPPKWVASLQAEESAESQAARLAMETPEVRARAATEAGAKIFQIALPVPMQPTAIEPLGDIEDEGWTLTHADYVYDPSAERIVGIYIFRAKD